MQQIKLKGFSSWGGKNAQHCRYSTLVAEMLQKKFFYPFYRTFKPHWNHQKKKESRKRLAE